MVEIGSPRTTMPLTMAEGDSSRSSGGDRGAADWPSGTSASSARIAAELRRAILEQGYGYGERLPPERHLATVYGASRSTVREALRQLEELHLVRRRVGSGTFVSYREGTEDVEIAEATSPLQLIEVRLAVEPQMTRMAVVNASARDLERMGEALRRVESIASDAEAFSRADEDFHLALAACSRNPLMLWLYRRINDVRGHAQWDGMKDQILGADRIAEYNRQHRALFDAIRSRDVEAAVRVITAHLDKARRDLMGVAPDEWREV